MRAMAQLMQDGPAAVNERQRLRAMFGASAAIAPAGSAPVAQLMTARIKRTENRDPTADEIETARAQGRANSRRVASHGRKPHGKRTEVPDDRAERQAEEDRAAAEEQAIQLRRDRNPLTS